MNPETVDPSLKPEVLFFTLAFMAVLATVVWGVVEIVKAVIR